MRKNFCRLSCLTAVLLMFPFFSFMETVRALNFLAPSLPTFGIVTSAQIISESVTMDFDSFAPDFSSSNYSIVESVYTIKPSQGVSIEFSVPFIGNATDHVNIDATINGTPLVGEIMYGDGYFTNNNAPDPYKILNGAISSDLSDAPDGTLYKFTPKEDTLSVDMCLSADQPLIYDTTHSLSSRTGQGYFNLKLNEVEVNQSYYFFVGNGDFTEPPVSNAEYTKQTLSCRAYIDGFYEFYKELFDEFYTNVTKEFYYAEMYRALNGYCRSSVDEFFFDRLNYPRGNAIRYIVHDTNDDILTVSIKQKAQVQINSRFSPSVFMVRYMQAQQHPTDYVLRMNKTYPFLLESNVPFNKHEQIYKCSSFQSSDISYFIFSSSQTPIDLQAQAENAPDNRNRNIALVVCIPIGAVVVVFLGINIYGLIKKKHR